MMSRTPTAQRAAIAEAIARTNAAFPLRNLERRIGSQPLSLSNVAKTALRYVPSGGAILDFGSGACHKPAVLQCLGFRCSAADNLQGAQPHEAERVAAFAGEFGIDFRWFDATKGKPLPFAKESFDMVMLHHVIEHLHDSPRELLNDLLELLRPGALLFITVPNAGNIRKRLHLLLGGTNLPPFDAFYWHPDAWTGHVREYVRGDLALLAKYLNLQTLELKGIDDLMAARFRGSRLKQSAWRLGTAAFRGWKDTWQLVARKNPGWTPVRTPPPGTVMASMFPHRPRGA